VVAICAKGCKRWPRIDFIVLAATVKNVAGPLRAGRRMSIYVHGASAYKSKRRFLLASIGKPDAKPASWSLVNSSNSIRLETSILWDSAAWRKILTSARALFLVSDKRGLYP